ncbi:SusC/RagA family TonB-linked outer membrane protein [Prevotella lacticifex]|uniref:SusC/RagA family TonB-linked outer membrane protein n=1 Tax=Prevotella lacticifex TaxID=2854755 RepID=A0A9R1CYB0_9BACT|nr:TonB-dependent receptor [Prevotella lacticifex]GJG36691.1 SusC/RagA family TonB-linked outer membrane protein [Prevotella lacticifex]GJG38550.1 SusC/RagA family TonB-linked outer membrane protein [Prevotella lacticifex]GJG42767.1 SusC/RagA family TonB-linked outer membrane protein [Prevotella lacticifex]GJG44907.1 SusC/RagA family TonB-linked outer membrane protein [Prevotella lacticifex]GJG54467.1 SusC/RagA family TonB-linked outer membrane protein [Prevotella lacticifex]
MDLKFRKTALMMGACLAMGGAYAPNAFAASPNQTVQAVQQSKKVTGHVVDADGPIIGASVVEKGNPKNGAITDLDGNFEVNVPKGATLVISYVGYKTREIVVGEQSNINVTLSTDEKSLEDVVVVGYGVQKKKLVTGATVEVKGDDVQKLNTTQVLGALQSQTPGVNIQAASGQPGDGFKVSIRGVGSNLNSSPLYIIDGVAGDINNLNPADIERIDVLKDAASSAIYGSAAANGVILVTTKQGQAGKIQISYDGNVGWQNVYRLPQLLNAKQYMDVMNTVRFNSGADLYDWSKYIDADLLEAYNNGTNKGTNWVDAIRNKNAVTTSHAINITGGSDRSKFSIGTGYQYQDGVFGKVAKSDYRRFTFRINSEHVAIRSDKGFDVLKVGENVYFAHKQNQGIQIGNQYSNVLSTMLRANPCVPIYDAEGNYFDWDDIQASGTEGWQNYNSYTLNPIYQMVNSQSANNKSVNYNLNAIGYVEIQPIKGLTYRGQLNYNHSSWSWRAYLPVYTANMTNADGFRTQDRATNQVGLGWGWSTTNTLNYKFDVKKHNFDVLFGTEYGQSKPDMGFSLNATASNSVFGDLSHAYMTYMKNNNAATVSGQPYDDIRSMSYFGRINYNYDEKYMFTAIMRADGNSKFAPGHRWGYFPSFSAGWVISSEKWMESVHNWMDYLKLRAGWGQNGNVSINNFEWQATFAYDDYAHYSFDSNKDGYTNGVSISRLANNDLTWETSEQFDLGIDARFLRSRLGFTFDLYNKKTKDLLVDVPVDPTTGKSTMKANAGTVENKGFEIALSWNDRIGDDFQYNVGWNLAYNHNEVTKVNSSKDYNEGGKDLLAQNTGYMARFQKGHPIGYFYGYKTEGVMQNAADVQAYLDKNCGGKAENSLQGTSIKPGDLKFVDTNGDGVINSDDKTDLGNPHPDVTMGINLGASWKGFDISVTGYGAFGQQVARSYRKFTDGEYENYTTEVYSYWNGEGTSNKYPLLSRMNSGPNWQQISDIYVEDASYFRLQNLTVGYDFTKIWKSSPFQQLRLYFAAQNLFTITGYKGMDPENGMALNSAEPWVTGVDVGNYPQPRTYMFGVNVKF